VAQIITFNTLGARAAIKDVGRVLEVPFADVERSPRCAGDAQHFAQGGFGPGARLHEAAKKDRASTMS